MAKSPPTPQRATFASRLVAPSLVVVAVAVAYSNALDGAMVFDDHPSIERNESLRTADWAAILVPPPHTSVEGRPVVNLSLAFNHAMGGLNVRGYHLFNIAVHVAAALALLGLARRTLSLPKFSHEWRAAADAVGLCSTLLWALHPVQTESVTYITQRAEAMAGLAYLSCLYFFVRGATASVTARTRTTLYALAVMASALGMATKESVVTLPVVAMVHDRLFLADSWRETFRLRGGIHFALAATWLVLAAVVFNAGTRSGTAGLGLGVSPLDYLATQFGVVTGYLGQAFWPSRLAFDHGDGLARGVAQIAPYATFILALASVTVWGLCRARPTSFLGVWFFATLAPSSSVVPIITQTSAEPRMYLPLAAVAVGVTCVVFAIARKLKPNSRSFTAPTAFCLALAGMLGVATYWRNTVYASEIALLEDSLAKRPNVPRAMSNLGARYSEAGRNDLARQWLDRALAFSPNLVEALNNRSGVFISLGEPQNALVDAEKAAALAPDNASAHFQRAMALVDLGRDGDAMAAYDRAIELDPGHVKALYNRAHLALSRGDARQAIADLDRSLTIDPSYALAYRLRGQLKQRAGDARGAIADFSAAISLAPRDAEAFHDRGFARHSIGLLAEALADYNRAIAIDSRYFEALLNRGNLHGQLGQFPLAVADHSAAIRLSPDNAAAYRNRAVDYFNLENYDAAWRDVAECQRLGGEVPANLLERLSTASGRAR